MFKKSIQALLAFMLVLMLTGCRQKTEEPVDYEDYLNKNNPVVTIVVEGYGTMKLELFYDVAPNTVRNFVHRIQDNYYEGLTFHRVIEDFMIQGGWGATLPCKLQGEFDDNGFDNPLLHTRGVISMARTTDPNSATGQFFIMHTGYPSLDGKYAAFGGLIEGFKVLDAIASVDTNAQDAPLESIVITSITIDTKGRTFDPPFCFG